MRAKNGLPSFSCSKIAEVLVGDQPCMLAPWFQGRFKFDRTGDQTGLTNWKAKHTTMLQDLIYRFRAEGYSVTVEQFFKVTGATAILNGKFDAVLNFPGRRSRVIDAKSGEPKESHIAQVMIEIIALPIAWQTPLLTLDGEVIYETHSVPVTYEQAMDLRPKLFSTMKMLALNNRPEPSPSETACRYCDAPSDMCSSRFITQSYDGATDDF